MTTKHANYLDWLKITVIPIGVIITLVTFISDLFDWVGDPIQLRAVSIVGYVMLFIGICWFAFESWKIKFTWQRVVLVLLCCIFTIGYSFWVSSLFFQHRNLPVQGQLIIPAGYSFKIPGDYYPIFRKTRMTGTVWRLPPPDNSLEKTTEFAQSIASDRITRYGGRMEDYPILTLMGERLSSNDRSSCEQFGSQTLGASDTILGDTTCTLVIEYVFK
jgi:hypothetical protein